MHSFVARGGPGTATGGRCRLGLHQRLATILREFLSGALLSAHQVSRAVGGRRIACDVRVLFFCVADCDVTGTKIAGTADALCVGPTAAAEEDTEIVHVAAATDNEIVGFVIDYNGTKIVNVVIGFGLE